MLYCAFVLAADIFVCLYITRVCTKGITTVLLPLFVLKNMFLKEEIIWKNYYTMYVYSVC